MIQVLDLTNPYSTFKYCSLLTHLKKIQFEFQHASITGIGKHLMHKNFSPE